MDGFKKHLWGAVGTVVVFLIVQTCSAVWWASSINTRVNYLDRDMVDWNKRLHAIETARGPRS